MSKKSKAPKIEFGLRDLKKGDISKAHRKYLASRYDGGKEKALIVMQGIADTIGISLEDYHLALFQMSCLIANTTKVSEIDSARMNKSTGENLPSMLDLSRTLSGYKGCMINMDTMKEHK